MTGELFAVLRDHSLLGAPAAGAMGAGVRTDPVTDAFLRGVRIACDAGAQGIAGRLFSTRTLFLADDLAAEDVTDHLSGLLIGDEIRAALADAKTSRGSTPVLVGVPSLCARYRAAFLEYGLEDPRILGDTAPAGLWTIATAAGLIIEREGTQLL
jgi:2-dehydro-3-deoxygalactonokinase